MTPTSANGRLILTLVRIQLDALGSITLLNTCHSVAFITRVTSHSAFVDTANPGDRVEERDEEHERRAEEDLRRIPDAEPHDQHRRQRHAWDAVEREEKGIEHLRDIAPARQQHAETD